MSAKHVTSTAPGHPVQGSPAVETQPVASPPTTAMGQRSRVAAQLRALAEQLKPYENTLRRGDLYLLTVNDVLNAARYVETFGAAFDLDNDRNVRLDRETRLNLLNIGAHNAPLLTQKVREFIAWCAEPQSVASVKLWQPFIPTPTEPNKLITLASSPVPATCRCSVASFGCFNYLVDAAGVPVVGSSSRTDEDTLDVGKTYERVGDDVYEVDERGKRSDRRAFTLGQGRQSSEGRYAEGMKDTAVSEVAELSGMAQDALRLLATPLTDTLSRINVLAREVATTVESNASTVQRAYADISDPVGATERISQQARYLSMHVPRDVLEYYKGAMTAAGLMLGLTLVAGRWVPIKPEMTPGARLQLRLPQLAIAGARRGVRKAVLDVTLPGMAWVGVGATGRASATAIAGFTVMAMSGGTGDKRFSDHEAQALQIELTNDSRRHVASGGQLLDTEKFFNTNKCAIKNGIPNLLATLIENTDVFANFSVIRIDNRLYGYFFHCVAKTREIGAIAWPLSERTIVAVKKNLTVLHGESKVEALFDKVVRLQ